MLGINCCLRREGGRRGGNYVDRSEFLSRGCGLFSLSVDVIVFAIWYLKNGTKSPFTLGVKDPRVKSPNIMLVVISNLNLVTMKLLC